MYGVTSRRLKVLIINLKCFNKNMIYQQIVFNAICSYSKERGKYNGYKVTLFSWLMIVNEFKRLGCKNQVLSWVLLNPVWTDPSGIWF